MSADNIMQTTGTAFLWTRTRGFYFVADPGKLVAKEDYVFVEAEAMFSAGSLSDLREAMWDWVEQVRDGVWPSVIESVSIFEPGEPPVLASIDAKLDRIATHTAISVKHLAAISGKIKVGSE